MVYVIANDSDFSVNSVLEWLNYFNFPFIRKNSVTKFILKKESIWLRKNINFSKFDNLAFKQNFSFSKLAVLKHAQNSGLDTPKLYDFQNKDEIIEGIKEMSIIMKPSREVNRVEYKGKKMVNYTILLTREILDNNFIEIKNCLFQEYVKPDFEVKSFFIKGSFFSSAIFRSTKRNSIIKDIRYDANDNNVYYEKISLPKETINNISKLMLELKIDFGCIDFVVKNNIFYFLEINQMGQFEVYSKMANLGLEKTIAIKIIEFHEKREQRISIA